MARNNKEKIEYRLPIVTSSFYQSPDGTNPIRFYEIVNANKQVKKLHKSNLTDLRIENFLGDAFNNAIAFFRGQSSNVNLDNKLRREKYKEKIRPSNEISSHKLVSHHTRNDGSMLTVTTFDYANANGANPVISDYISEKVLANRQYQSRRKQADFTRSWLQTSDFQAKENEW